MLQYVKKIKAYTSKIDPWWSIIFVPIWQEILFRYLPYKYIYLPLGRFWEVGIITNLIFAGVHWYMGKWFMVWSFFWGIVLWWVIVNFGLIPAVLIHALVNIADLRFGIRKYLQKFP